MKVWSALRWHVYYMRRNRLITRARAALGQGDRQEYERLLAVQRRLRR